jgi:hypothetical protein
MVSKNGEGVRFISVRHAELVSASIVPPGWDSAGGEMDPETSSG